MKRVRRADPHGPFLELLSRQLDEPLRLDESWALSVHLAGCSACRAAQRDYGEHRRGLRALSERQPPRDLGARMSAALDREVLRRPARPARGRGPWATRPALRRPTVAGTSAVVSLAVMTVGAVALLNGAPPALPDATGLRPTPLAVPGQALAYLGSGPDGLALYRTSVDRVCPPSAIDCVDPRDEQALLALSRLFMPSSLVLSPNGQQVAISARDADSHEDVFAVVVMPPVRPILGPLPATPVPSPSAPATRAPGATSPATATPRASVAATTDPAGPTSAPVASLTVPPTFVVPTPVSTAEALTMVAILEDVRGVGAPPAWSADGSILAFSAMPADGSRGPDIYVWRPGDESATAITADGASYFASWSGAHVVASRVSVAGTPSFPETGASPSPNGEEERPDAIPDAGPFVIDPGRTVTTVVLDPETHAESIVDGPSLWLPQVSPARTRAVAWRGRLEMSGTAVQPVAGGLYAFDWTLLDPFAGEAPDIEPTPAAEPSPPDAPSQAPSVSADPSGPPPDRSPSTGGDPRLTLPPDRPRATGVPEPSQSPPSTTEPATPDPAPSEPASPTTPPPSIAFTPLEPGRDELADPVLDWEVRWAVDGSALGFWVADAPGGSWGSLVVVPVDGAGELALDQPVLAPTLARRSFTLGHSRVAWVGPADESPDGELRISVWGPDGSGVLRFSDPELYRVLAAF